MLGTAGGDGEGQGRGQAMLQPLLLLLLLLALPLRLAQPRPALQLWACGGAAAQHQRFTFNRSAQTLTLGPRCLSRSANHQYASLLLAPCDTGDLGQRWNVSTGRTVTIQSLEPGSDFGCIGASFPVRAGGLLQLAPDCGTRLTEWLHPEGSSGSFRLQGTSDLCIDHGSSAPLAAAAHGQRHRHERRPAAATATLSNLVLPRDTAGDKLITGEADMLEHGGAYYLYFSARSPLSLLLPLPLSLLPLIACPL